MGHYGDVKSHDGDGKGDHGDGKVDDGDEKSDDSDNKGDVGFKKRDKMIPRVMQNLGICMCYLKGSDHKLLIFTSLPIYVFKKIATISLYLNIQENLATTYIKYFLAVKNLGSSK